jgi:hypothetical protein
MVRANRLKAPATFGAAVLFAALLMAVAGVEPAKAGSQNSAGGIAFTSDRKADADGVLDI